MKKQLAAAGLALGTVFGGVALGAAFFAPTASYAQEADEGTETTETEEPRRCDHRRGGRGLDAAAEVIGIEVDALKDALEGGQTIADVAAANGVDAQTVIDAMVADAEAHLAEKVADGDLTQEQADERLAEITEHITARVNGEEPARPAGGRRGPRGGEDAS